MPWPHSKEPEKGRILLARGRRKSKNTAPGLLNKTGLVPDVVAARVANEVFQDHPDLKAKAKSLIAYLASKAEAENRTNSDFGDHLKGKDGADGLAQSMRTWAKDYIQQHASKTVEAATRKPKMPRGERRYVIVTDSRNGKEYKVLTSVAGSGFPVIMEIPGNKHRAGAHKGMLITHDDIVKAEVYASKDDFVKSYRAQIKLQISQGLSENERAKFYKATVREIEKKDVTSMSNLQTLISECTLEAKAAKRTAARVKRVSGQKAPKPKVAAKGPAHISKSLAGLQVKLNALAKKYEGVTFPIKELKTKKNAVVISGLSKMPVLKFAQLLKDIPNTSHIPQSFNGNTAVLTLFGTKAITGHDVEAAAKAKTKKPRVPRPYYIVISRPKKGGKWTAEFGDFERDVAKQEMEDQKYSNKFEDAKDRLEYKVIKLPDAKPKTMHDTIKTLASESRPPKSDPNIVPKTTSFGAFAKEVSKKRPFDVVTARITNPAMINDEIIHKIAHAAYTAPGGYITVNDLRKQLPLLDKENIDSALTKMHLDQVIQMQTGPINDTDTVNIGSDKFSRIYPMDTMMQVLSDDELHTARNILKSTKKKADEDPTPDNKNKHQRARKIFAKVLKRIAQRPAVPYAGPAKASRSEKTKIAASVPGEVARLAREMLALKKEYRLHPTPALKNKMDELKKKQEKAERDSASPMQHAMHQYEKEQHEKRLKASFDVTAVKPAQHYALMQEVARERRENTIAERLREKLPLRHHKIMPGHLSQYFKRKDGNYAAHGMTDNRLMLHVMKDIRQAA